MGDRREKESKGNKDGTKQWREKGGDTEWWMGLILIVRAERRSGCFVKKY